MFKGLKKPKNLMQHRLFRGVTDFGNTAQFDLFETGYSFLVVCKIPRFIEKLMEQDEEVATLVKNYLYILENEFKGLSGIENITSETSEITDGISTLNMITKVTEQGGGSFSMNFTEKSGSVITKFHEFYLKGIKDSRSQAKSYHGLVKDGILDPGFENEVFTLLYIVTDNTYRNVERAYLIVNGQITTAETSMYETTKGDIGNKELSVEFNGFPISGNNHVNLKAKEVLNWMHNEKENPNFVPLDSANFLYTGIDHINSKTGKNNGTMV